MRWLVPCLLLLAASCGKDSRDQTGLAPQGECVEAPIECPAQLNCQVSTQYADDGSETRICGGPACCESFCALNSCQSCCVSPAP